MVMAYQRQHVCLFVFIMFEVHILAEFSFYEDRTKSLGLVMNFSNDHKIFVDEAK